MDLIDRSEVQYKMLEILPEADSIEWYEQAKPDEVKDLVDELYNIVLNVNQIDAQQVKHGEWIVPKNDDEQPYFPVCNWHAYGDLFTDYCPGCGAYMVGD